MKPEVVDSLAKYASPTVDAFFRSQDEARRKAATTSLATAHGPYPGDFTGVPKLTYNTHPDELPNPGEVVWAWVPFADNNSVGKDRPVLIVSREAKPGRPSETKWLLGLPLTSVDHEDSLCIGSGGWDVRQRESFVRLDRIIRVDPRRVRRIGGQLDEKTFWAVAANLRRHRKN